MAKGNGKISELGKISEITNDTMFEVVDNDESGHGLDNYQATALQIEGHINRENGAVHERISAAVTAEKGRAEDNEREMSERQDDLEEAIANEKNRAEGVEGDIALLETTDKSNLVAAINTVKRGGNANAQEITKLQKSITDLGEYVDQHDEEMLDAAKAYTDEAQLATQTWVRAVDLKSDLELITGLNKKITYLCRVIADPDPANNGVYQAIAGWSGSPAWTFFSDNQDWIDENELDERIGEHDEDESAHGGIKADLSNERQQRTEDDIAVLQEAKAYTDGHDESGTAHADIRAALSAEIYARIEEYVDLLEQINALTPEGLENLPALLASKAPVNNPVFTGLLRAAIAQSTSFSDMLVANTANGAVYRRPANGLTVAHAATAAAATNKTAASSQIVTRVNNASALTLATWADLAHTVAYMIRNPPPAPTSIAISAPPPIVYARGRQAGPSPNNYIDGDEVYFTATVTPWNALGIIIDWEVTGQFFDYYTDNRELAVQAGNFPPGQNTVAAYTVIATARGTTVSASLTVPLTLRPGTKP